MKIFQKTIEVKTRPVKALIEELAGSISPPKRFKGFSIEKIIQKAQKEYFGKRKRKILR